MRTPRGLLVGGLLALCAAPGVCLGQSLQAAAERFAEQWSAREVSGLSEGLSLDGVRLQWELQQLGSLNPPHAAASMREYLGSRESVATRVAHVEEVAGDPPRGYAELRWDSRIEGTSDVLARTLFVAFVSEGGTWRVTELRVLPLSRP